MSKGRKKNRSGSRPRAALSEGELYQRSSAYLQALSGFEGANHSDRRGWIYWPTLDTKRELDTYSRLEMLKKSRWLRANTGLPNRICRGLSEKIGYLTPLSASGDEVFDRLADELWRERACEAAVIDASGTYDIRAMQIEMNVSAFGDGDILPVLIKGSTDGVMLALYEAHQIMTPPDAYGDPFWIDGVKINKFRRHVAYGLSDSGTMYGRADVKSINAKDAMYYAHPDAVGRIRPTTILGHAINHLIDISEILADVKLTIKVAAQLGMYIENQKANSSGYDGPLALGAGLRNELATAGSASTSEGTDPKRDYVVEDFLKSQGGLANLPAGAKVGTIQDTRPHPNQMSLINHLIRDIAWGVGVPPEILWDIHEIGGASVRMMNADLDRWIAGKQIRQLSWMRKFRSIWIANEIQAGRLPEPAGSAKFWKAAWLPQASITADKGRMGSLDIDLVKNNMRSLASYYAEQGLDWQTELTQIAKERVELNKLGLAMNDLAKERDAAKAA
jgi:capsid protein